MELYAGRRAPFSQLGDWVMLSGIPGEACKLYWIFMAHVSRSRGEFNVRPKREDLAALLGKSLDSVDKYSLVLKKLGAIDIIPRRYSSGMQARNAYRVHETPPPGYTGMTSLGDFYTERRRSN